MPARQNRIAGAGVKPDGAGRVCHPFSRLGVFLSEALANPEMGGVPKHTLLFDALVNAIATDVLTPGNRLPAENDLTRLTPFSLGTVQKALSHLADHGYVTRKPGAGTIVVPWRQRMNQPLHCRFGPGEGDWLPVFPHILSWDASPSPGRWSAVLTGAIKPRSIDRRLDVGEAFSVYSRFYVDADRHPIFAKLDRKRLQSANFKELMQEFTDVPVVRVRQSLRLKCVEADSGAVIGLAAGDLALHIDATGLSGQDQPLYYQELIIPPNVESLWIDSRLDAIAGV